jgi:hypothetical protein
MQENLSPGNKKTRKPIWASLNSFDHVMSLSTGAFQVVMCHHSAAKIGIDIIRKLHVYFWSSAVMVQKIVPMVEMK